MSVLVYFLERPGQVVSKEELLAEIWDGKYVSDDVVAVAVYQIRKALGERASMPTFLETVHRRGYRWRARVEPTAGRKRAVLFGLVAAFVVVAVFSGSLFPTRTDPDAEARVAYAKGRYFLDRRSPEALGLAITSFEQALARSPGWAAAEAGIADALALQVDLGMVRGPDIEGESRRRAEAALALDPASAEAWTSLGVARLLFDFDLSAAEEAFRLALERDPDNAFTHQAHAWQLSAQGRLEEAIEHARRASELAPTLTSPHTDRAFIFGLAGRHDEAVEELELALELDRSRPGTHAALGWAHVLAGREEESLAAFRAFVALTREGDAEELARWVDAEGIDGFFRYALAAHGTELRPVSRARLHAVLGEADRALEYLEHAYREGDTAILWIRSDPAFEGLYSEARFRELLREL